MHALGRPARAAARVDAVSRSLLFNKPFRVLSQFSPQPGKQTLADYIDVRGVYAAGRLDYDSEGLMLLTDDGALQARIANPRYRKSKTYLRHVLACWGPKTVKFTSILSVVGQSLPDS